MRATQAINGALWDKPEMTDSNDLVNGTIPADAGRGGAVAPSLRQRVLTGGAAVAIGFGIQNMLRLASNLVLTRLLAPEAFGLMSVAISFNVWALMLTEIGIGQSIIRSKNSDDPDFLHTAWVMQIVRNLLIASFIFVSALTVFAMRKTGAVNADTIFADPQLPWIMAAMAAQIMFTGVVSLKPALASRRLTLNRVVGIEIAMQLVTMTCSVVLALNGFGVWSLVIGVNVGGLFFCAASYLFFSGPSMRFHFYRKHFDEIFHFGKWLIISSFFGFIINRGDHVILGWLMPGERFSLYAVAMIWIGAALGFIQTAISRIFYPSFSEVYRENPERLTRQYQKVRNVVDGLVIAVVVGVFFFAEPFLKFIYTDEFHDVGFYVRLLTPMLLFLPYRVAHAAMLAAGDSRSFSFMTIAPGTILAVGMPLMFNYFGETSAILFFACISAAGLPIQWRASARYLKLNAFTEGRMLAVAVILIAGLSNSYL